MILKRFLSSLAFGRAEQAPSANDCGCPESPGGDPDFAAALTALGAKLARADGRADGAEYASFVRAFPPQPKAERDIRRLFVLAGGTTRGFESYARRIGKRYGRCPELLEKVIDGLFRVAEADGVVTAGELAYLQRVSDLVGLSPLSFRRLRSEHLGAPADDPYRVLGVAADASEAAVRAAWKHALREHHPDVAAGQGLSPERIEAAERRATAINAAFEAVMRERRAYGAAA